MFEVRSALIRQNEILPHPLTEREQEILQWMTDGLSDAEIGEHLFLSLDAVDACLKSIYGKLFVHERTAAVVQARIIGVVHIETFNTLPMRQAVSPW